MRGRALYRLMNSYRLISITVMETNYRRTFPTAQHPIRHFLLAGVRGSGGNRSARPKACQNAGERPKGAQNSARRRCRGARDRNGDRPGWLPGQQTPPPP